MKPIFIVKIPDNFPHNEVNLIVDNLHKKPELNEDYHVLISMTKGEEITFQSFNSPYSEEEFTKLKDLIEHIQNSYDKISRSS